jgi:hypothetical protein
MEQLGPYDMCNLQLVTDPLPSQKALRGTGLHKSGTNGTDRQLNWHKDTQPDTSRAQASLTYLARHHVFAIKAKPCRNAAVCLRPSRPHSACRQAVTARCAGAVRIAGAPCAAVAGLRDARVVPIPSLIDARQGAREPCCCRGSVSNVPRRGARVRCVVAAGDHVLWAWLAGRGREAVGDFLDAVGVAGAVAGPPRVGDGLKVEALAWHDICSQQHQQQQQQMVNTSLGFGSTPTLVLQLYQFTHTASKQHKLNPCNQSHDQNHKGGVILRKGRA